MHINVHTLTYIYMRGGEGGGSPIIYDLAFMKSNFNVFMLIFSFLFFI